MLPATKLYIGTIEMSISNKQNYKPATFDDLIFESDIARKLLQKYADGTLQGNLLLHGPYGSSKSTVAKFIAEQQNERSNSPFSAPVTVINGADDSEKPRKLIESSWNLHPDSFAYVVIDEFDLLSGKQQGKVRKLLDEREDTKGLILTTNHISKIDGALRSRFREIEMPALSPEKLLPMCKRILHAANIRLADAAIIDLIQFENGDIRKVLRQIEAVVADVKGKFAA